MVLAILGINMLLALTSRQLTSFEKHYTRSSEARSLAHRLFLAQVRMAAHYAGAGSEHARHTQVQASQLALIKYQQVAVLK